MDRIRSGQDEGARSEALMHALGSHKIFIGASKFLVVPSSLIPGAIAH